MPKITLSSDELPADIKQGENFYIRVRAVSLDENRTSHWVYHEVLNNSPDGSLSIVNGGTVGIVLVNGSEVWRTHTITESGDIEITEEQNVNILLIGGGGGGGAVIGGGGGAGGVLFFDDYLLEKRTYPVTIGQGGLAYNNNNTYKSGDNGTDTIFNGWTAIGGGGGGGYKKSGNEGGSSGGSASNNNTAASVVNQGSGGGNGDDNNISGGGGGYSQAGEDNTTNGGKGGDGIEWPPGSNVWYAGGGGGGIRNTYAGTYGQGGKGGGGAGRKNDSRADNGQPNTGSGGGGGGYASHNNAQHAGFGGSGVVVIAYRIA